MLDPDEVLGRQGVIESLDPDVEAGVDETLDLIIDSVSSICVDS